MMKNYFSKTENIWKQNRGVSLFVALVVASALLLVAFTVSKIVTKGLEFAGMGRDSQIAFFAADAGIECALYWDVAEEPSKFDAVVSGSSIDCAGVNMRDDDPIPGSSQTTKIGGAAVSRFGFTMNQGPNPKDACVIVVVTKAGLNTIIESFGYNTCDTNHPRRVERGLEVNY